MRDKFLLFDRWGSLIEELPVEAATYRAQVNGEDTLQIDTPTVLSKGDRILWRYSGVWREHVVNESAQTHDGAQGCSYTCDGALQWDLRLAHISYTKWTGVTADYALRELLELTSWTAGVIEPEGTATFDWQKMTAYSALLEIAGAFDCELVPEIVIDEAGVVSRSVSLVAQRGRDTGLRFDYGHGVEGVTKEVLADDVITACYGYGASSGTGANSQLTFASINGGVPYIVDEEALQLWGIPDGKGGLMHAFGYYENSDCKNQRQLLEETADYLSRHNSPMISYQTNIPFAVLQGVGLGDGIAVTDRDFTPPLRMHTRVGAFTEDLIGRRTTSIEFGTIVSLVPDALARAYQTYRSNIMSIDEIRADVGSLKSDLGASITTGSVTITDGDVSGTLTVKEDGLYYNDQKLGGA